MNGYEMAKFKWCPKCATTRLFQGLKCGICKTKYANRDTINERIEAPEDLGGKSTIDEQLAYWEREFAYRKLTKKSSGSIRLALNQVELLKRKIKKDEFRERVNRK